MVDPTAMKETLESDELIEFDLLPSFLWKDELCAVSFSRIIS